MTSTQNSTGDGLESGPEVGRFIEQFALNMAGLGFPRMPARVFVAILISDDGRTATDLAELLQISRAAVSQSVRYLLQLSLVTRDRVPGQRRDHYRAEQGMWYEMFARRDEAFVRLEADLMAGIKALGPDTRGAARLDETRRFFEFIRGEMPLLLDHWREMQKEQSAQDPGGR